MYQLYEYYGAHKLNDTHYLFRVYAPHAKNVTIKTNNISMPMHQNQEQDWEIVLSIKEGEQYRYQITTQEDEIIEKLDPFSFSIVNQEYSIVYDYKKLRKSLNRPAIINDLNAIPIIKIWPLPWQITYQILVLMQFSLCRLRSIQNTPLGDIKLLDILLQLKDTVLQKI